jgi:hypothetical protein
MSNCIVCNNDVDLYKVQIGIGGLTPPYQKGDTLATVCPSCGVIRIVGADLEYVKGVHPIPTQSQLDSIDIDTILDEMVLPGRYVGENLKWISSVTNDESMEAAYEIDFGNGYNNYGKYNRLVNFLLMDTTTRISSFGAVRCPTITAFGDQLFFKEGRRRFHLLRFLGAGRVPVSVTSDNIDIVEAAGIVLYDSKE